MSKLMTWLMSFDVDAAADDVGGDQDGDRPVAEPLHDAVAGRLGRSPWIVATPGTRAAEPLGEPVGPALRPGEDDALAGLVALEQVDQQVELPVVLDRDVVLLDRLDRGLVPRQVQLDRLVHVALGELADRRRLIVAESSRVWCGLGTLRRMRSMSGRNPMSSIRSASSRTTWKMSPR